MQKQVESQLYTIQRIVDRNSLFIILEILCLSKSNLGYK